MRKKNWLWVPDGCNITLTLTSFAMIRLSKQHTTVERTVFSIWFAWQRARIVDYVEQVVVEDWLADCRLFYNFDFDGCRS
jgi:hypothetical protein